MTNVGRVICACIVAGWSGAGARARAAEPITIGLSMELTGPLAVVGKTGLLAMQIWQDDINAKGGLLGRPVKLVFYDDQSNPSTVPGIYTKLIDIDKVDLLVSSYGTNLVVPAIAGGDPAQPAVLRIVCARRQRQVPLSEILLDAGVRAKADRNFLGRLFRSGDGAEAKAADDRDRRRRRRVFAQRLRRGARARQGSRARHRLRPNLPADDGRLLADRARGAGGQPRHRLCRLLSARHGRHPARRQRTGAQDRVARRRLCRAARRRAEDATRPGDERHRQCRAVGAAADDGVSRGSTNFSRNTRRGRRAPASTRSAISCRPSPMPKCRFWAMRSPRPEASTRTSSPNTCTATRFTRSSATSRSGRTANGPRGGRSGCNITASRATISTSSKSLRPCRSCCRPNTRPAT